jgi:2-polyprenyl-3-methyl-5-hydroxy-6-metoxy-1,4-benzoquinol methylase
MGQEFYQLKNISYFKLVRMDIVELVPESSTKILEIGCGAGETGLYLKKKLNAEVTGIELFAPAADEAAKILDKVIIGDIETMELNFPKQNFDCIIFPDVLEHCRNPWKVLQTLSCFLNDKGYIVASIPNIRYLVAFLKIMFDKLEYMDNGVLDISHLRFFTLHTIKKMFSDTGFDIIKIKRNKGKNWKFTLFNILTFGLLKEFSVYQYLILAKKLI